MSITTISSRAFNQDVSKAKRAALSGPVFITDRGHTAHVLLSIEEYEKITHPQQGIAALLSTPECASIEFEPAKSDQPFYQPADFS